MNFFDLTSRYKEMALLEHIESFSQTTQKEMSLSIDSSPSMVNSYLEKLEEAKLIHREYESSKKVKYHITSEGIKRKNYLQIKYIKELMDLYIKGQESVSHFLKAIQDKGFNKIFLYGAGEVAEIILDIIEIQNVDLEVVGIIDDNESKQGRYLKKIPIITKSKVHDYEHDGIVITSFACEKEIIDKLISDGYLFHKIIRYFEI